MKRLHWYKNRLEPWTIPLMNKTTFKAIMKPTRLGNNFLKHKYDVMKEFITPKKILVFSSWEKVQK